MPQAPQPQTYTLPQTAPAKNHGRTLAGWVLAYGITLGVLVTAVGLIMLKHPVMLAGVIVIVLSLLVSLVLRKMGKGQPGPMVNFSKPGPWYND